MKVLGPALSFQKLLEYWNCFTMMREKTTRIYVQTEQLGENLDENQRNAKINSEIISVRIYVL